MIRVCEAGEPYESLVELLRTWLIVGVVFVGIIALGLLAIWPVLMSVDKHLTRLAKDCPKMAVIMYGYLPYSVLCVNSVTLSVILIYTIITVSVYFAPMQPGIWLGLSNILEICTGAIFILLLIMAVIVRWLWWTRRLLLSTEDVVFENPCVKCHYPILIEVLRCPECGHIYRRVAPNVED